MGLPFDMTWNPYPMLPLLAIKDLLVVTRVLYRAAREAEPQDHERLNRLEEAGFAFRRAVELSSAPPGTIDHGNAWAAAERARDLLAGLVTGELAAVLAPTLKLIRRDAGSMV